MANKDVSDDGGATHSPLLPLQMVLLDNVMQVLLYQVALNGVGAGKHGTLRAICVVKQPTRGHRNII